MRFGGECDVAIKILYTTTASWVQQGGQVSGARGQGSLGPGAKFKVLEEVRENSEGTWGRRCGPGAGQRLGMCSST